jgi:hypothetical protein
MPAHPAVEHVAEDNGLAAACWKRDERSADTTLLSSLNSFDRFELTWTQR